MASSRAWEKIEMIKIIQNIKIEANSLDCYLWNDIMVYNIDKSTKYSCNRKRSYKHTTHELSKKACADFFLASNFVFRVNLNAFDWHVKRVWDVNGNIRLCTPKKIVSESTLILKSKEYSFEVTSNSHWNAFKRLFWSSWLNDCFRHAGITSDTKRNTFPYCKCAL